MDPMNQHILPECTQEQDIVLRNESDVSSKSIQTDCADIVAINLNFTVLQLHSARVRIRIRNNVSGIQKAVTCRNRA
jgi:hypothetical protein